MRMQVLSLALIRVKDLTLPQLQCSQTWGSEPELLWLRYRLAAAALIQTLATQLPYATGAALKRKKKWIFVIDIDVPSGNQDCVRLFYLRIKKKIYNQLESFILIFC